MTGPSRASHCAPTAAAASTSGAATKTVSSDIGCGREASAREAVRATTRTSRPQQTTPLRGLG